MSALAFSIVMIAFLISATSLARILPVRSPPKIDFYQTGFIPNCARQISESI
jgi:hypothetical protein